MSLTGQVNSLATRIGTEFKSVRVVTGNLSSLSTTAKGSLVAAINEVNAKPSGTGGASINDNAASTTTVYSSSKTESYVATAVSAKPSVNDSAASSTSVYSSSKTDAQIANAISNRPVINDTTPSATTVFSANKTNSVVSAAVSGILNGAPAALDTLKEINDALGGDANFAATISAQMGNRVRFDAAQTLTTAQLTQVQSNLQVVSASDIGNVNADFVSTFEAALV